MQKYQKASLAKAIGSKIKKPLFELSESQIAALKSASEVVLAVVAVLGIAAVSIAAPNALAGIHKIAKLANKFSRLNTKQKKRHLTKTFYYLKDSGLIEISPKDGGDFEVKITAKGRKKITRMNFLRIQVPKTKKWDGRWWLVLADIPTEDYKNQADMFRKKLKNLDLFPLQRTVWAYPYDPRDEIDFIAAHYGIDRFVTCAEVITLDEQDEKKVREHFSL